MALTIYRKDNRFRVQGQEISLDWLADTRANRKAAVVFLRLLSDPDGHPLFTHQQLAPILGSSNRQAASRHLEAFLQCGGNTVRQVNCSGGIECFDSSLMKGLCYEIP